MNHEHIPHREVNSFEDAWYGGIKIRISEEEYDYIDIICKYCHKKIKANKELTKWVLRND